jgi:hypothetical protein
MDSGVIRTETLHHVRFDLSAVLAYDRAQLSVGQAVTFDLEGGSDPMAVNVVVQRRAAGVTASWLRYVGFEQSECVREYRFEQIIPGEKTKRFIITADLGLFARHRVGCQEGPALCLRLLKEELDTAGASERSDWRGSLTDEHMLAHLARHPAPRKPGRPERKPVSLQPV